MVTHSRQRRLGRLVFFVVLASTQLVSVAEARGRRRFNRADFANLFLAFNPNVLQTSSLNPLFLNAFNPFGFNNFSNLLGGGNGINSLLGGFGHGFNNVNNAAALALGLNNLNIGSHFNGGAIDPSLLLVGNNGNNNNGFNNRQVNFSPFNAFGLNNFGINNFGSATFGDTSNRGGGSAPVGGMCGGSSAEAICGNDAGAKKAETEQAVKAQSSQLAAAFGGLSNILGQAARGAVSTYDNYLASFSSGMDFTELVNNSKRDVIAALQRENFNGGDISAASTVVNQAQVIFKPNVMDPSEMYHFNKSCGLANDTNNAFACPFHNGHTNKIFICGGRIQAALKRAGGNWALAMADLAHTIKHEISHMVGSEPTSPFAPTQSMLAQCLASQGTPSNPMSEVTAEKTADYHAAFAMANSIANGETFGLSPEEYLARSMARLCATPSSPDHPSGKERIELLSKIIRSNEDARAKLPGCPALSPGDMVCSHQGLKSGGGSL